MSAHTSAHAAGGVTPTGAGLPPSGPPPSRARPTAPLTNADIAGIARRVRAAVRRPPPDDQTTGILAAASKLTPQDEDRVIAALAGRRAPDAERAA